MTTHSPSRRYQQSLRQKPSKMLDYGKQECMNVINNNMPTVCVRRQAETFGKWFNNLIDVDRNNLGLYIADDAVLQWFGRTVKTKKDITGFLKYDMNCTSHLFTSVKSCEPIKLRGETVNLEKRDKNVTPMEDLAMPISGVTPLKILKSIKQISSKSPTGKRTRSLPSSPEVERSKKPKTSNDKTSVKIEFDKKESIKSDKSYAANTHIKYELRIWFSARHLLE
ncbi:uncharacterized protein LOC143923191 isoform X2 [Arctopsyche grandis]|uniref:uncharacterized protein LOC143923191 isoform X2 n=1 Tax=Arctopsyche grandis TaxID=121162 RepID=UPI00406D98D7